MAYATRRARGNRVVEMVDQVHSNISFPINEASPSHLQILAINSDLPDFLTDTFYRINNTFRYREDIRTVIEQENEDIEYEDDPEYNELDADDMRIGYVPDEIQMKRLLTFISSSEAPRGGCLMIVTAIMDLCDTNFGNDIQLLLEQASIKVESCSLAEFAGIMKYKHDYNDIKRFSGMTPAHHVFAVSILVNLIGKHVNASNYPEWKVRRTNSYSAPLMLKSKDTLLLRPLPSLTFASTFYMEVRCYWTIRRRYFIEGLTLSQQHNILGLGMRVAVNLLRGSEMTNLSMIMLWIIDLPRLAHVE